MVDIIIDMKLWEKELNKLLKWKTGKNKGGFNWKRSISNECRFEYNNIENKIKIVDYDEYLKIYSN